MRRYSFESVIEDVSGGNTKIQKGDYLASGAYPIIDQGQDFIGGFSNDSADLVRGEGPWIVFGDHTRALKFVEKPFCMGADGVKILKLRGEATADLKYVFHFLQFANIPSAGYSRHYKFLKRLEIPLPPLDEQKRIAAILDKADAQRRQRRQALTLLDSLTQSIFLEMFGDPVSNPKGWNVSPLGAVADFMSGGTPSKSSPSYWVGQIPWVSPKDMKSIIVRDSIDHISEKAVQNSAVKLAPTDAILLVVRGMILAHTVPIGILARPAAFNQDIKAILFGRSVSARFGLWNILVQSASILQKVSTAAHGTKRLDMESVMDLPVLCPPTFLQNEFVEKCVRVERLIINSNKLIEKDHSLFVSIQEGVFGERVTSA